ncbi:GatB/YqeY domain-containing protein [Dermatophilus congolensis]|uniref:GatB/YqeY domain-containing protein n=1 Tax=Dermatophilus congolensis TaxID=1863 RepID=UPI001AAEFF2C|nr:GatB/YqeY domain-containing protein [Dermatophilus congolensis]MBO3143959.1 GatB/YqeY domain-containing protein [Dermatophilus congolensis]MBO3152949.1 GatB/YqeY domain-containing protein [Dermatophilus congolensis]MBO3160039.1 GatB/YqeY domain-containing protein [Dermatophilus congolensis]MBO3164237.1 GatB/YqeY domain-containing protein [Dermatophilus congolensis]MBO3177781.1 GatB/YqeY domain-containing protein [Dermatophilus congolensis]
MTSLKEQLHSDLNAAMKARDEVVTATLRMVMTAISNAEVAGKEARSLSDDEVLKVLAREAKSRKESVVAYSEAGRPELADRESAELAVLEKYLPAQLEDAELAQIVDEAVSQVGATGMKQMGQVMKVATAAVAGRADGGRVSALVKARLMG